MATNFMTLNSEKQEPKKTVFKKYVGADMVSNDSSWRPDQFKNVLHLGKDNDYGDVFKAWDDDEDNFFVFFGTAGDEFKK